MPIKKVNSSKKFHVSESLPEDILFPTRKEQPILFGWTYHVATDRLIFSSDLIKHLKLNDQLNLNHQDFIALFYPDDQKRLKLQWKEAILHDAPLMGLFRIMIGGTIHWFEMMARANKKISDNVVYMGTLEDLTRTIHPSPMKHATSDPSDPHLLSTLSHELRTPMNAIVGFADLLSKELKNEEQHLYVERIQDAADHMLAMINDILDLSKIDAGKLAIEQLSFSLKSFIETTIKMMEPLAKRKHLFLESEIMNCPTYVVGDPYRIRQILINLISNAIKFTETGGISLVIQGESEHDDHIDIKFLVKDTGIGLTEPQMKKLFNAFEQAEISTSRLYGGTGLGLSISSKLARLMHGTLQVKSQLNEGSTFTLALPLRVSKHESQSETKGPDINLQRFKNTHILIAEDHQLSQILIEHILSKVGVHVTLVDHGKKAVDYAKSTPFDWILLDMEMPLMNGIDAARAIRRFNEKTPILGMTASHLTDDRAQCLLAGMNDVITKPIDRNHLLMTLLSWLPDIH